MADRQHEFLGGTTNQILAETDEHTRRFACDSCRAHKLRCERKRVSLETPLRSTACVRCTKSGLQCTTSSHARIGKASNGSASKISKSRALGRRRASSHGVRRDDYNLSGDDDDFQLRQSIVALSSTHVVPHPGQIGNFLARETSSTFKDNLDPCFQSPESGKSNVLPESTSERLEPKCKLGCSKPNESNHYTHYVEHHEQAVAVNSNLDQSRPDSQFLDDVNQVMDIGLHQNELSDDFNASCLESINNFICSLQEDEVSGKESPFRTTEGTNGTPISESSTMARGTAASFSSDLAKYETAFKDIQPSPSTTESYRAHSKLMGKLVQLTHALTNELESDNHTLAATKLSQSTEPGHRSQVKEQTSPLTKLLRLAEEFLGILEEIRSDSSEREISEPPSFRVGPSSPPSSTIEVVARQGSSSLPVVTVLMAILTTYSSVLEAYERIFGNMYQSLSRRRRPDGILMTTLPLFHLDGVKFASQRNLRMQITLEVSVQMLDQIERRLSSVVDDYDSSFEGTKNYMQSLLRSLILSSDGDQCCASATVRELIKSVRRVST